MIDRTEHDVETESKMRRATVDDDPHPEGSLDPDIPTENELRDEAETARD